MTPTMQELQAAADAATAALRAARDELESAQRAAQDAIFTHANALARFQVGETLQADVDAAATERDTALAALRTVEGELGAERTTSSARSGA